MVTYFYCGYLHLCGVCRLLKEHVLIYSQLFFPCFQTVIVKLKLDKDRKKILERRAKGRELALSKGKGKHSEDTIAMETS